MTTAQATTLGEAAGVYGAPLSTMSDGAIVMDGGVVIAPDGMVWQQTDYVPSSTTGDVSTTSTGSPISDALANLVTSLSNLFSRSLSTTSTGTTPTGTAQSSMMPLLLLGVGAYLLFKKGGGGGGRSYSYTAPASAPRRRGKRRNVPAAIAWQSSQAMQRAPFDPYSRRVYGVNARRRRAPSNKRMWGAFKSKADAERRASQHAGARIVPWGSGSRRRYSVMTG